MRMEAYSTALYEHYKGTPGRVRERKEGTVTRAEQVFFLLFIAIDWEHTLAKLNSYDALLPPPLGNMKCLAIGLAFKQEIFPH